MADTLDLITLVEGYQAINDYTSADAGTGNRDAEMARWITAISRRVDEMCGPVVARALTELHDGGGDSIRPNRTPVYAVTTLTEYDNTTATVLTAESNSTKPTDGYVLDRDGANSHTVFIIRRSDNYDSTYPAGRRNVELVYQAGRAATTAAVDAKFKTAAGSILRRLWARDGAAWARGGAMFDQEGNPTLRFFRAVDPMVTEFLSGEMPRTV